MRIDQLLVEKGFAKSRTLSQKLISSGLVEHYVAVNWQAITKSSMRIEQDAPLRVAPCAEQRYVSRAGLKLEGALKHVNYSVKNCVALDIGQSTGGFTDCLLQQGATKVVGVDVGRGQLNPDLRRDERVSCLEGVNARELSLEDIAKCLGLASIAFELCVMDVSFISQTHILPRLGELMQPGATLISLVKPQFEVGPEGIGKGGLVKDAALYRQVESKICEFALAQGLEVADYFESSITGGDGNREFFLHATKT